MFWNKPRSEQEREAQVRVAFALVLEHATIEELLSLSQKLNSEAARKIVAMREEK